MNAMAEEIEIPGSGQTLDLSSPMSAIKGFAMAALAFMLTTAAGSLGVWLYNNVIASNTSQEKVDLI